MTEKLLQSKKVLITAGPTREYWDPVRFITNASSGTMGIALAKEAHRLGATVVLVLGPASFPSPLVGEGGGEGAGMKGTPLLNPPPQGGRKFEIVNVISAWDMYQAVKKRLQGTDIFVGAAAVVDYRPVTPARQKIKRR